MMVDVTNEFRELKYHLKDLSAEIDYAASHDYLSLEYVNAKIDWIKFLCVTIAKKKGFIK